MRAMILIAVFLLTTESARSQTLSTKAGDVKLTRMISGLDQPWALGFLPNNDYLLTERSGKLFFVSEGTARKVSGVPKVVASGQGGLLDVMIPRDFASTRQVYFSYSKKLKGGAGTAVAVATLSLDGKKLSKVKDVFQMNSGSRGGRHFGSRIVEALDGTLLITLGERGDRPAAQDLSRHHGAVVRINRDGTIPSDNPFVGRNSSLPEVFSYGHRNPQGAALDANGTLWIAEHGAKGGDEINKITSGGNYGWPVISYGTHYSGAKIGEGTERTGMKQPAFYWDPSIAPSGLMIYSGKLWPVWRGDFFVGSLKFDYISRLSGGTLKEVEQLKSPETTRVRDVAEAPDGSIWFISVGQGAVYRISPN